MKTLQLNLTWRIEDGALVQAVWNDGTKFFNEAGRTRRAKRFPKPFPASAACSTPSFRLNRRAHPHGLEGPLSNTEGDHLVYAIPNKGYSIEVGWTTRRGTHLISSTAPPIFKPNPWAGSSRSKKGITAMAWAESWRILSFVSSDSNEEMPRRRAPWVWTPASTRRHGAEHPLLRGPLGCEPSRYRTR